MTIEQAGTSRPESTPEVVSVGEVVTAVVRGQVPFAELNGFFDRAFAELGQVLGRQGVRPAGAAYALYHGEPTEIADLEVGMPTGTPVDAAGQVLPSSLPAGRVARMMHIGAFDELPRSYERLVAWMGEQGLNPGHTMWEVYLTEPSPEMDPRELRTELNWLLAD